MTGLSGPASDLSAEYASSDDPAIEAASRTVGIKAVVLDVIDDGGTDAFLRRLRFYERMGFVPFPSRPTRMFIVMSTVRKALESR